MNSEFDAVLVLPYYGKYPIWINAFLRSCAFNPRLKWMIFSDIKVPDYQPANVEFIHLKKSDLTDLIYEKTGIRHALDKPHKLCDFKPLYGHIFEAHLGSYDYWGHCDMDVIWGDMRVFLDKIGYNQYDIISTRPRVICGHFTLYRNVPDINHFYKQVPNFRKAFEKVDYQGFDEGFFSYHLFMELHRGNVEFKVFWEGRNCLDPQELARMPSGWRWKMGKLKNRWGKEGNYLHLIQWKKSLEVAEVPTPATTQSFEITRLGVWANTIPKTYRKRMQWEYGLIPRFHWLKARLSDFLKFKLLRQQKPHEPSVLPQYRELD